MRRIIGNDLEIYDKAGNMLLILEESYNSNVFDIKPIGAICNETVCEFEDEIMAALSVCKNIAINLSDTTDLADSALTSLLSIQQIVDNTDAASLVFYNLSQPVEEIFMETGLIELFYIKERQREDAV